MFRWSKTKTRKWTHEKETPIDARINKSLDEYVKINEIVVKHMENYNARKILKRLQRSCEVKDEHKNHHMKECAFKAQPKASINMAIVTLKNVEIMENQNALVFFMILELKRVPKLDST